MNFIKENLIWIIITIVLTSTGGVFFNKSINSNNEIVRINNQLYEVLNRSVDTVFVDRVITEFTPGETISVEVLVPVEIPIFIETEVDTLSILKDYFSTRVYTDTLTIDDRNFVIVRDTISQNKVINRYWEARISERVVTETITVQRLPRVELWAGFYTSNNYVYASSFGYVSKSRKFYGIDLGIYSIDSELKPYIGVRYLWQIR